MIELPKNIKKIAIKMSGGADSSLVAFLISKYIVDNNLSIKMFPVIIIEEDSPFQEIFAKKCISIIESLNNFKFESPLIYNHASKSNKIKRIREVEATLENIELIVSGTSQHPKDSKFAAIGGPDENRKGKFPVFWNNKIYTPLINLDKKEIASIYKDYNLIETLFPCTRSCVAITNDFTKHCGECWWCKERIYGFGKL